MRPVAGAARRGQQGEAFLPAADDVAGGQVAEAFGTLLRMAVVLSYAGARPVVKVVGPLGDGAPARRTYHATAAALNLLRGITAGHHTDVRRVHQEIQDFVARSPARARHTRLTRRIAAAIRFMEACGATPEALRRAEFFTGHEARDMAYETALTRTAERGGRYGLSGHLLCLDGHTRRAAYGLRRGHRNPPTGRPPGCWTRSAASSRCTAPSAPIRAGSAWSWPVPASAMSRRWIWPSRWPNCTDAGQSVNCMVRLAK
ncbi:3-deoxy-7-phosphoheptulonate synthase [Streptomyces sp. 5-8]|uniref:Phospho-2-dehydro-3-deoxyheptonate aldolase n=1 Tax=Streptomyces musisoli TaxID=2802280 RepID=A0ABS1NUX7_9ACTN|nr:3-deoxy-7-phosphoheptulonate synthase [Streptomyces musisoli]MBL1103926.1 3-deoxy-7-phosphoheptulonate synthase [Streptomyces musisoli]